MLCSVVVIRRYVLGRTSARAALLESAQHPEQMLLYKCRCIVFAIIAVRLAALKQ